jgi:hypothetical protein
MTTIESPATGRGRTAAAERVPVPVRQRRPGLAALAVLLILGGAALSGYIAITSGEKKSVVALSHDVQDGEPITAADLTTIDVSAPNVDTIPGSQLNQVVSGHYRAAGTYPRGTILVRGMLVGRSIPGNNFVSTAVIVPEGQYPPQQVSPGSAVKVIYTPRGNAAAQNANGQQPIPGLNPGDALVPSALVTSAKAGASGTGIFTIVVPNNQDLSRLALANAAGAVTLVKLADNERPATGA